jgi:hypothetical protein
MKMWFPGLIGRRIEKNSSMGLWAVSAGSGR